MNEKQLRKEIRSIISEEELNEAYTLSSDDLNLIRRIIRKEVASIFWDLYKKRKTWE